LFSGIYKGKRVLVTGHTGFKGSWLSLWLQKLGAEVSGMALPASTTPNHHALLALQVEEHIQDIRDAAAVEKIMAAVKPEIVFHLAAQPLVRRSYRDPLETYSTNVMGTANVLEACRKTPAVRAIVAITTDKCYENLEIDRGYDETDRLGGHDPYSASKAAAELVITSYRKSFFSTQGAALLASARAGNVIGGGDWSEDRLIPDLARAVAAQQPLVIRSPKATRPWQHVLEPLAGYLRIGQLLLEGQREAAGAYNLGPDDASNQSVETVLNALAKNWPAVHWQLDAAPQPHEAKLLHLKSDKAKRELGWQGIWSLEQCLAATAEWYRAYIDNKSVLTAGQLDDYIAAAKSVGAPWA